MAYSKLTKTAQRKARKLQRKATSGYMVCSRRYGRGFQVALVHEWDWPTLDEFATINFEA